MASKTGSVNPASWPDETFDLYSIPSFDTGEPAVVRGSDIGSTKQVVRPNDVLLSKIVPHIRRSWVVGENRSRRLIASGEWIVFRSERVHPPYLRQVLVGDPFHARFMSTVSGVGGSLLRARPSYVANLPIPLPPLAEQRRIAEVLDLAEALRVKRRAAIAQLGTLIQSIFREMFGEITEWPSKELRTLVTEFRYGTSVKSEERGYPALRIPNVLGGAIDFRRLKLVPLSTADFNRLQLSAGDMLFVRTNGNPEYVGRCAVFDPVAARATEFDPKEFVFASYLIRARLSLSSIAPIYAREFMLSPSGRQALRARCKTSAGQFNLNTESLGSIPVPVPPLGLQQDFAARVAAVGSARIADCQSLTHLDDLFASLQHHAFRGEL